LKSVPTEAIREADAFKNDRYSEGKDSKRTKAISGFFSLVPVSYSLKTYQEQRKRKSPSLVTTGRLTSLFLASSRKEASSLYGPSLAYFFFHMSQLNGSRPVSGVMIVGVSVDL